MEFIKPPPPPQIPTDLPETLFPAIALLLIVLAALALLRLYTRPKPTPKNWLVIDGSNVMHWNEGKPSLETLRDVIQNVRQQGYTPGIMFDANAGYLLTGKYLHDRALGRMLGVRTDHVMVVDKGTPADPAILQAARDLKARVVTNDRFRDWADEFPEVREKGHLISGRWAAQGVELDFAENAKNA